MGTEIRQFLLSILFGILGYLPHILDDWFLVCNQRSLFLIQQGYLPVWLVYGSLIGIFIIFLTLLARTFSIRWDENREGRKK